MIDMLNYIDELEAIKKLVEDQKPRYLIVDKINEYIGFKKKEVDEFEKWAEAESQKDAYLEGTVVSDTSDSPFLAHPSMFPGEKSK
tara:strand:+ start:101 stop:358 length:258 start_codon:yes stop_codon:yes gene_type:complete